MQVVRLNPHTHPPTHTHNLPRAHAHAHAGGPPQSSHARTHPHSRPPTHTHAHTHAFMQVGPDRGKFQQGITALQVLKNGELLVGSGSGTLALVDPAKNWQVKRKVSSFFISFYFYTLHFVSFHSISCCFIPFYFVRFISNLFFWFHEVESLCLPLLTKPNRIVNNAAAQMFFLLF
jgi:hypothetical protein